MRQICYYVQSNRLFYVCTLYTQLIIIIVFSGKAIGTIEREHNFYAAMLCTLSLNEFDTLNFLLHRIDVVVRGNQYILTLHTGCIKNVPN